MLTTKCHDKPNIISFMYDRQSNDFNSSKGIFVESLQSSVPPNYLVVPYREFVLRTSIACKVFKLDNPRKDIAAFHPKYSSYLRGLFPYVIPYTNITFDDIERFYVKDLIKKTNKTPAIRTSFAENITFENIPYTFKDEMWHPAGVISAQRTAILVPLQGRDYNAKTFLLNMHAFLRRQQLTYTIILIEQVKTKQVK